MASKRGNPIYRTLMVDGSEESKQAVEFMEGLGIAYVKQDLTGYYTGQLALPAVSTSSGAVFQGLDDIKRYEAAYGFVLSEQLAELEG